MWSKRGGIEVSGAEAGESPPEGGKETVRV